MTESKGYYLPETKEEAAWEIIGRVNALHDFMEAYVRNGAAMISIHQAAAIMGFKDILIFEHRTDSIMREV